MSKVYCIKSAAGLFPSSHQADIRIHSYRLLWLDNKSTANCQQAWCKLIVKTFYPQAQCNLFQQLAASLQISSCIKSDFRRLGTTCQGSRNLCQAGQVKNLHQVHRRTRRGGQVPPQFGKKNDLFGQILILFGQLSSVLKFIKGAFECCPKIY